MNSYNLGLTYRWVRDCLVVLTPIENQLNSFKTTR